MVFIVTSITYHFEHYYLQSIHPDAAFGRAFPSKTASLPWRHVKFSAGFWRDSGLLSGDFDQDLDVLEFPPGNASTVRSLRIVQLVVQLTHRVCCGAFACVCLAAVPSVSILDL